MNDHTRLATAAALASMLLVTGCGAQHPATTPAHPATDLTTSTPCQITATRVDQYAQAPQQVPACVRARLASRGAGKPDPCPVVADRIEQQITRGLVLPSCIRRLQHEAVR